MIKLVTSNYRGGDILEKLRELVAQVKAEDPQLEAGRVVDLALVRKDSSLEVTLLFQA